MQLGAMRRRNAHIGEYVGRGIVHQPRGWAPLAGLDRRHGAIAGARLRRCSMRRRWR
jgi:hypothetical protein